MYLVRVTQLEQYRKWITGCPYINEQSVIDSISGNFQGNNKTRIGTAGHSFIEGSENLYTSYKDKIPILLIEEEYPVRFSWDQLNTLFYHRTSLDGSFHEQKNGKDYETKHYPIHVGGTQDVIHGITIHDTKFVFRSPDYSNYTDSCQWKYYLEFLNLDLFYFDLFEFIKYKDEMGLDVSSLEMVKHEPIECVRYINMENDNQQLVNSFVDWIEFRKIRNLLKQKEDYYS